MPKFIIDTDELMDAVRFMSTIEVRRLYIADSLRTAHASGKLEPWLTPVPEKKTAGIDGAGPYTLAFNNFWDKYPARKGTKSGKRPAFKAWAKASGKMKGKEPELYAKCMEALDWQTHLDDWRKDDGEFVPMASTWLNQERWEDEKPEGFKKKQTITNMDGTEVDV